MNDNDLINNSSMENKYKATRNLNTEIENPQINISSAVGLNIKDTLNNNIPTNNTINNYFNENLNQNNNELNNSINTASSTNNTNFMTQDNNNFIQTNTINNNDTNNFINTNNTQYNNNFENESNNESYIPVEEKELYQPTLKEKKKQKSFKIPSELKIMMFIIFILLLFILVVPYIYDFIKEVELSIMS